jgi:hypothetical protein
MTTAKEYRTHAKSCFARAQETDSEESRQASLEMASYWMDAAMRTECLSGSQTGDSAIADEVTEEAARHRPAMVSVTSQHRQQNRPTRTSHYTTSPLSTEIIN